MTAVKFCGLGTPEDIAVANALGPEYAGFVFVKGRKRYVSPNTAEKLREMLSPGITPVGVFIDEDPAAVADLLNRGVIAAAQLHGGETDGYISELRRLARGATIIKAFIMRGESDARAAEASGADFVLLDAGTGSGSVFPWELAKSVKRGYFLAGGLNAGNVAEAIRALRPYAVDVSSGIEKNGRKDPLLARGFITAARGADD